MLYKFVVSLLPLKVNRSQILFISWGGAQYSCSPKAIFEYIIQTSGSYEMYWAEKPSVTLPNTRKDIHVIKIGTFSYYLRYRTSEFIIFNCRMIGDAYMEKKHGQKFVQTWHGTAIKKLGNDSNNINRKVKKIIGVEMKNLDVIISGSDFMTNVFKSAYSYTGQILNIGFPRNDIFFRDNRSAVCKIKQSIGLPQNSSIVLYAPTFRDNGDLNCYNINPQDVLDSLNKNKQEKNWYFAYRYHPKLENAQIKHCYKETKNTHILDLTLYPNMEDLLISIDVLITDYSSSILDFSLSKKPAFIYASDYEAYDRGAYIDVKTMPFPFSENMEDLCKQIENFDYSTYEMRIESYLYNNLGFYERGTSCEQFMKWLMSCER